MAEKKTDKVEEAVEAVKAKAEEVAEDVKAKAEEVAEDVKAKAKTVKAKVEKKVAEKKADKADSGKKLPTLKAKYQADVAPALMQ